MKKFALLVDILPIQSDMSTEKMPHEIKAFLGQVCYQTALSLQLNDCSMLMPFCDTQRSFIAHRIPKQRRSFGYASLPCAYQTDTSSRGVLFRLFSRCLFPTSKRPVAIAHLRKSSKYGHSAPVPEAVAFSRQARSLCAHVPEGTSSRGILSWRHRGVFKDVLWQDDKLAQEEIK